MDNPGWKDGKSSSHAELDSAFAWNFCGTPTRMFCCTWLTDTSSITDLNNTYTKSDVFRTLAQQSVLLLTEITFSANRVFRTPFQNVPDLLWKTKTMEHSCTKLSNTAIFRIYSLNTQKCSFSATSFTEEARKTQMLCFLMIWFRALKPLKLDFKVNHRRWILSSSKWFNSSLPFLANVLSLGSKDNTKPSSFRIVNPNPSNQRGWK